MIFYLYLDDLVIMSSRIERPSMNFSAIISINKKKINKNAVTVDKLKNNYNVYIFPHNFDDIIHIIVNIILNNFSKSMTCKLLINLLNDYIINNIFNRYPNAVIRGYDSIEFDIWSLLMQFYSRICKYHKYFNKMMINGIKYDSIRLIKLVCYLILRYNNKLINTSYHIDDPKIIGYLNQKIKLELHSDELYEIYSSDVILSIQYKYIKLETLSSVKSSYKYPLSLDYYKCRLINMVLIFKILPLEIIEKIFTNVLILEFSDNVNSFIKQIRNNNKDKNKSVHNYMGRFRRHRVIKKAAAEKAAAEKAAAKLTVAVI